MVLPPGGNGWTLGTRVHQGALGSYWGSRWPPDGPPTLGASTSGDPALPPPLGGPAWGSGPVDGPWMLGASASGTGCRETGAAGNGSGVFARVAEGDGGESEGGGCSCPQTTGVKHRTATTTIPTMQHRVAPLTLVMALPLLLESSLSGEADARRPVTTRRIPPFLFGSYKR